MTYTPGLNGGRINATIGGNTAGAGALISTGTMNLMGGNNITLSQNGQSLTISGPNQSAQPGIQSIQVSNTTYTTGNVIFSNANNITFGSSGGGAITASYSQSVQTQNLMTVNGTQGAVSISGGNNVTVGNNASTITISAANQSAQTQNLHNVSLSGNTAGVMAQISSGTLSLAGGNNITLSQNGNAVTISGTNQSAQTQNLHNVTLSGNTAGVMAQISSGTLSLAGGNNITLSQNGNAVTISGANGGGGNTYNYFNPQDAYVQVAGVQGQNTLHIQPMQAINVQFDRVVVPIVASITATSATATFALTYQQGLYTRNVSTLSLLASWSASTSFQYGTSNSSLYGGGLKLFTIPVTSTITEGQYYMGNLYSSSSAGANALSFSQILASQQNSVLSGIWGSASNSTVQYTRGLGTYSNSTAGLPSSIGFTQIRGMSSLVLRQPIFYFASGTF